MPYLPEPTGSFPVGTTSLWLRDASRPDPWAAGVDVRELMVTLWYPAGPGHRPRLRPGLLRPAPAGRTASPAWPSVTALPRGHFLFSCRL